MKRQRVEENYLIWVREHAHDCFHNSSVSDSEKIRPVLPEQNFKSSACNNVKSGLRVDESEDMNQFTIVLCPINV